MIHRVFWATLGVEALALVWLLGQLAVELRRGGPDAGMGSLAIVLVLAAGVALSGIGYWFRRTGSPWALALLLAPGAMMVAGAIRQGIVRYQVEQSLAGNEDFREPGMRRLANAIAKGDVAEVRAAIASAGDLNQRGERGVPILVFAAASEHLAPNIPAIVGCLLDAGADPNLARDDGYRPLEAAVSLAVVQLLLERGADPNARGTEGPVWFGPLGSRAEESWRRLELYLSHGARFEGENHRGEGPVGVAAQGKNWRGLRKILEMGARGDRESILGEPIMEYLVRELEYARGASEDVEDLVRALALLEKSK